MSALKTLLNLHFITFLRHLMKKTGFFVGWKDIILYLLDLPELKALRHNDISKEELVKMLKDKMTKEELLSLLLG